MPRDSDGRVDLQVAANVLVKVELEDPPVSAPDVCFIARDDWSAARTAREVASSRFLRRFVFPQGSDGRVPSEILESILGEVKLEEEELVFSAFDSNPFLVDPSSS